MLSIEDTVQEKPHTNENDVICWPYGHSPNRSVKGFHRLPWVYPADGVSVPVTYELSHNPIRFRAVKTRRVKRTRWGTNHEQRWAMGRGGHPKPIPYRSRLADRWFSAQDSLPGIRKTRLQPCVVARTSHRTVALSTPAQRQGAFPRVEGCALPEHQPVLGWVKGLDFPVLLLRQLVTHQAGSTGPLYRTGSGLTCAGPPSKQSTRFTAPLGVPTGQRGELSYHAQVLGRFSPGADPVSAHAKEPLYLWLFTPPVA